MDQLDIALLVIRVWAGIVMLAHGAHHARSLDGTAKWFASKGFRQARLNATLSAYTELAIGLGLITGLFTPFAAAGLTATMLVAFWAIHRFAGFYVFRRPDEGYEYVVTLIVIGFVLALLGPGELSVDDAIGIADDLDGWIGVAIFGGGVLAASGMLVTFWTGPSEQTQNG